MRSFRLLALSAVLPLALVGCTGGGDDDDSNPDPVIPAPANVAAVGGFETVQVTWDAVPGAIAYRVYAATSPKAPLENPIEVTAPPLDHTVANWVTMNYRVTAVVGLREGTPSLPVTASASAGYIVAARTTPRGISTFHADDGVLVDTIPNARFTSLTGMFDNTGKRIGTHWGIPSLATSYQTELGIFTTSQAVVLGAEAGHEYEYLGYIASTPPRVFFRDFASSSSISIHSAFLDGTDSRVLLTGCVTTSLVVPRPDGGGQIASAEGLALQCDKTGTENRLYYSDGVSPAVELPGAFNRWPKVLTSTHLVLYDAGIPLPSLFTQSLTAPFTELKLVEFSPAGADSDEVHVNPAGIAWIRTYTSTNPKPYRVWVVDTADPSRVATRYESFQVPLWEAMSPDGLRFATIYQQESGSGGNDQAWVWQFEPVTGVLANVTPGSAPTTVSDISFLENGKILVTRGTSIAPTGIYLHNADGLADAYYPLLMGDPGLKVAAGGIRGEQALFIDANGSGDVQSVELAFGGGRWIVESAAGALVAPAPSYVTAAPQYVTYVNDAYQAWIATSDPDLSLKQQLDLTATNLVTKIGEGAGNRIFFALRREEGATDQTDIVMVDLDLPFGSLVATPIVSGPTDDYGLYFP